MALAVAGCAHRLVTKPAVDHGEIVYRHAVADCDAGDGGDADGYAAAEAACGAVLKSPLATPAATGRALRNRAALYELDEKYADAIADYMEMLRTAPNDPVLLLSLGRAEMKIGRCAAAAHHYGELLRLSPRRAEVLEARGDALVCARQDDNAVRDFTAALAIRPRAPLYDKRATAYLRLDQADPALQDFDAALALHPRDGAALAGHGSIALERNDYAQALQYFDAATVSGLQTADIAYGRGAANLALRNYAAAVGDLDHALKLNPRLAKAHEARATALLRQGDYDRALQDYAQLIAMNRQDGAAYFHRGQIFGFKGDYERAIADYSQAIAIDPARADALVSRGDTYMARGQYDLAAQDFERGGKLAGADKSLAERLRRARAELAKQQAVKGISIEATYPKH